jgi:hypothetical protein
MEIAFLIDKDSVFNTVNFKKIIKSIEQEENVKISTFVTLKRYFHEDFIISFTDKYEEYFENIKYKVYSVYNDENVIDMLNNDLLYLSDYYSETEYEDLFFYEKNIIKKIITNFKKNNKLYLDSKELLRKYSKRDGDFIYDDGKNKVIVSAPHNVSQFYNGLYKRADFGTGTIVSSVKLLTDCNVIIKTKNIGNVFVNDNANRGNCAYKNKIARQISSQHIKALIDVHSLKKTREEEINIGINDGRNINNDTVLLNALRSIALKHKFTTSIDTPFYAGKGTIANFAHDECNIVGIQLELNAKFINYNFKSQRYNDLVNMISEMVEYLDNYVK